MGFLQNLLNVISLLSFLNELSSPVDSVSPEVSLWGKMANFTHYCSYWKLKPGVSVPALGELTVCLHLQTKASTPLMWTAFMYRSPEGQWAELGLGGRRGYLSIWLFGREWRTTAPVYLPADLWHYLCVSWSHTTYAPSLYVNGRMLHLFLVDVDVEDSPVHPPHRRLAPNGTLTLGTSHFLAADGTLHVFGCLKGWLSLFRMWGRARSRQEVTSVMCTGGDVLKWEENLWEIHSPVADSTLLCDWSLYEVRVRFLILRHDGKNTNLYTARDLARRWLREVLPLNMTLHSVSVFELASPHAVVSPGETVNDELKILLSTPTVDRFDSVVQVNVFPSMDVSVVQADMSKYLQASYTEPHTLLYLMADPDSIYTISVESFDSTPTSPAVTEKPSTAAVTFSTTSSPPAHTSTKPVLTNTSPLPLPTQNSTSTTTTTTKPLPTGTTSTTSTSAPVTMTTTTFTTAPENISGLYFEVKLNVSITGDCNPEESLKIWLETSLPPGEMVVLNFQLLPKKNGFNLLSNRSIIQVTSSRGSSRESCVFQVHVMKLTDGEEIEKKIRHLLEQPYNSSSISVATQDIQISRILVLHCPAHRHQTRKGLFAWPKTWATHIVNQPCPGNKLQLAWRHCKLGFPTRWMVPDLVRCPLVVERIPDLNDIEVTAENAADVVEMIESLLSDHSTLSYEELVTVLNKLKAIVSLGVITPDLGRAVINIISVIMESDSQLGPFTNTILNITEDVGDRMWGYDGSSTLLAPAIAISVVDVHPGQFDTLTFAVSSAQEGLNPEIYINKPPFSGAVAFISLPPALKHSFPQNAQSSPRVQFQFYGIPMLFKSSQQGGVLNTFVVSASVTNVSCPITQLGEDVQITLHHLLPNTLNKDVQCVYWNFNRNGGHGGWDGSGCRKHNTSAHYTTCLCDHLTHFGVLLDMSRSQVDPVNDQILTIITYLGCGVSSLFLGVTVLTYTAFEKLRRDYPSKILINLSLALLGLNLVFLVNSWLASWGLHGLCVAAAAAMHYFLLASFTWMGLEAVNMYFALVKVFNVYVPSYILKFCLLGWGVPLLVCVLVLIVNREAYGSQLYSEAPLQNADHFCWLQDDVTFYVSVVAYAVVIFLFNIAVFVVVLVQIRHMRVNRPAGIPGGMMQDLKGMASLTLLLGLTWTLGFFTWGPARVALLYLFSALNSLQGLCIFLFHCLMKENVRKQWRIHLCFGRFRLDEYSEWSHTASVGAVSRHRANAPAPLVHSVRSTKTSTTESTSASSDSSQRVGSIRRPSLGLFVNVMSLPRAQRGSSPLPYQSFPEGGEPYSPAWDHSPPERGEPYSPAWDHSPPERGEPYSPAWDHSPPERGEPYSPAWDHPPHP